MVDVTSINPKTLDSATNVVEKIGNVSGISGATNAITGAFGSIGKFFKTLSGTKLPLKNSLFAYATYDYVIGLGALSQAEINDPDKTYISGKTPLLICKSANADPNNRVKTTFGKFDFFINNLKLSSLIGFASASSPGSTVITFEVIEPYSMGMFFIACQTAADKLGFDNWREAPYVITLDFRGNKENGSMANIPGTKRFIPFMFADISMTADANGSKYTCKAISWGSGAITDAVANFKTDISAEGKTIQEVLQTGANSLQAGMNKKYREIAAQQNIETPDEILILFPDEIASDLGENARDDILARQTGPTTSGNLDVSNVDATYKTLGVSRSEINSSLVQSVGGVNSIGASAMRVGKPDAPQSKDKDVYNPEIDQFMRSKNTVNSTTNAFTFPQDTSVMNAINNIILKSAYADETLQASALDKNGMRNWWTIIPQQYIISSKTNVTTGSKAYLHVYKVIPYKTHASKISSAGGKAPGFENLNNEAVKEYNYMFTGKNIDIIDWKLKFDFSFTAELPVSSAAQSTDTQLAVNDGDGSKKPDIVNPLGEGQPADKTPGVQNPVVRFVKTLTGTDLQGGGGSDTQATRAARVWHDAVTKGLEMQALRMKIIGDPYYIAQSGLGNYHSAPTQYQNLNADGTINWASGEVDIRVNYRSPIDINQGTGLYNFGSKTFKDPETGKSQSVTQFSGLYQLIHVDSFFQNGQFTQDLKALRRPMQESTRAPTEVYSTNKDAPPAPTTTSTAAGPTTTTSSENTADNNGWGEG
jgi:hypothetical protein